MPDGQRRRQRVSLIHPGRFQQAGPALRDGDAALARQQPGHAQQRRLKALKPSRRAIQRRRRGASRAAAPAPAARNLGCSRCTPSRGGHHDTAPPRAAGRPGRSRRWRRAPGTGPPRPGPAGCQVGPASDARDRRGAAPGCLPVQPDPSGTALQLGERRRQPGDQLDRRDAGTVLAHDRTRIILPEDDLADGLVVRRIAPVAVTPPVRGSNVNLDVAPQQQAVFASEDRPLESGLRSPRRGPERRPDTSRPSSAGSGLRAPAAPRSRRRAARLPFRAPMSQP